VNLILYKVFLEKDFYDFNLLYTDASKNINATGCTFISGAFKRFFKLPTETDIYTAEIVESIL